MSEKSEQFEEATPQSHDEVGAQPEAPEDPATLQAAEDLDEDELGVDPLEKGMEPAERWSGATDHATTARAHREGETLDERLAEESPDVESGPGTTPLAETRMHELDDSVDEQAEAEVADASEAGTTQGEPVRAEHGVVLQGEEVERTGYSATTNTGEETAHDSAQPEEDAERIEDSGR